MKLPALNNTSQPARVGAADGLASTGLASRISGSSGSGLAANLNGQPALAHGWDAATLHEIFEAQVEKSPEACAVTFEGEKLTYRELNQRANQLGHHLRKLGVGPDTLVGVCLDRSLEMIVGI